MAEVLRNRPNNLGRNHGNVVYDQGADSDDFADDTILAGTIIEWEFRSEGDYEDRAKALEEKISNLIQQVQNLQYFNDQLTHATIEYQTQVDKLLKKLNNFVMQKGRKIK